MQFTINIEENKYITKFFKNNLKYIDKIKDNIQNTLPTLIIDKPYKIKTAYGLKYNGITIYEYKIKLDKFLDCRVAYTLHNNSITVFYISTTTIKRDFVELLKGLPKIS